MRIETVARANLIRIAKAYARATGLTLSGVSRRIYGKSTFLADFRSGAQSITFSNLDELLRKFSKAWPEGVEWPAPEPILMTRPNGGKKSLTFPQGKRRAGLVRDLRIP